MAVLPGQTPDPANRRAPEPPPGRRAPDAAALLRLVRPPRPLAETLRASGDLRARHAGKRVELCAIVNAKSGACPEDCRFCSQSSRSSASAPVYPLLPAERLLDAARRAEDDGAMRFGVVTSGNALRPKDFLAACRSLERLRAATRMALCASLGALTPRRARDLKAAGLGRYHHNVEASRRRFPALCSTHSWEDRVRTVRAASGAGLELCVGGIFGTGESWRDRAEMAVEVRELGPHSVPLNFLIPVTGTPLQAVRLPRPEDLLRIVALFRFAMPDADIRIAAGREHLGDLADRVFDAGANGIMIGDFLTRKGANPKADLAMLKRLGLSPGFARKRPC